YVISLILLFLVYILHHYFFLFFFLILPRPPISTLFPYTTLFRSSLRRRRDTGFGRRSRSSTDARRRSFRRANRFRTLTRAADNRDRKSTRLNSSHLGISYAVFCLKKKKK